MTIERTKILKWKKCCPDVWNVYYKNGEQCYFSVKISLKCGLLLKWPIFDEERYSFMIYPLL